MTGSSIIKFEDIGKPATVLIEKISAAVEGIYKPIQIKRLAKAQAEADETKAESEIKIRDLQQRALSRFVAEEAKKQENMEKITEQALPLLNKDSDPQKMEDDWITNFFDKSRLISDNEMQTLWAKLLVGEANSPGTFSKRIVNLMSSLDKTDAQLFTKLCGFTWLIDKMVPLVWEENNSMYREQDISFEALTHLDNIGLISFDSLAGFRLSKFPKKFTAYYYNRPFIIEFSKEIDNDIDIGKAIFTRTGAQLANICGSKPIDGFYDYVIEHFKKQGLKISYNS